MGLKLSKAQKKQLKTKIQPVEEDTSSTEEALKKDINDMFETNIHEMTWDELENTREMMLPVFTIHDQTQMNDFFVKMKESMELNKQNLDKAKESDASIPALTRFVAKKSEYKYQLNKDINNLTKDIPRLITNVLLNAASIVDDIFELYCENQNIIDTSYKTLLQDKSIDIKPYNGNEISELSIIYLVPMEKIAKLVKTVTVLYCTQVNLFDSTTKHNDQLYNQQLLQSIRKDMFSILTKYYPSLRSIFNAQKTINDRYESMRKIIKRFDDKQMNILPNTDMSLFYELKENYENNQLGHRLYGVYCNKVIQNTANANKQYTKNEQKELEKTEVSIYNFLDLFAKEYVITKFALTLIGVKNTTYTYILDLSDYINRIGYIPQAFENLDPTNEANQLNTNKPKIKLADKILKQPDDYHSFTAFLPQAYNNRLPKNTEEKSIYADLNEIQNDVTSQMIIDPLISAGIDINNLLMHTKTPTGLTNTMQIGNKSTLDECFQTIAEMIDKIKDPKTKHEYISDLFLSISFRQILIGNAIKETQLKTNKQLFDLMVENNKLTKKNKELEDKNETKFSVTEEEKADLMKQIQSLKNQISHKDKQINLLEERNSVLNKDIAQFEATKQKVIDLEKNIAVLEIKNSKLLNEFDSIINSEVELEEEADKYNREDFIKELKTKALVFIGGHEHWQANIQNTFPDAKTIAAEDASIPMNKVITADIVVINTAILNHPLYWRAKNAFSYNNTGTIVYLNTQSSNINTAIDSIHKTIRLKSERTEGVND